MTPMMTGSEGYAVQSLQEMLNTCGYETDITGRYDRDTKESVIRFQENESLAATGIADERTQLALAMRAATG